MNTTPFSQSALTEPYQLPYNLPEVTIHFHAVETPENRKLVSRGIEVIFKELKKLKIDYPDFTFKAKIVYFEDNN
jgi:hypothetical protein